MNASFQPAQIALHTHHHFRNRIRLDLVPALEEMAPGAVTRIARTAAVTAMENQAMERQTYFSVIRAVIAGAARGATPLIAVEYGRRAIPEALRPDFADLEGQLKG